MASILASSAFQMNNLSFYEVTAGAYYSDFEDNIFLPAGGTLFEDMYTVFGPMEQRIGQAPISEAALF